MSDATRGPADAIQALVVAHAHDRASAQRAAKLFAKHHREPSIVIVGAREPPPGVDPQLWDELALALAPAELVRAVVPLVAIERLRAMADDEVLLVLPHDAEVHGVLSDLADRLLQAREPRHVALFPRRFSVTPRDGRLPDDVAIHEIGRFDHDLFMVRGGTAGLPLLHWWAAQQRGSPQLRPDRICTATFPWLDQAPLRFDIEVVVATDLAGGYANADEADRLPSRLFRFPGFDPRHPWRLTPDRWARVWPSHHPWLLEACRARAAALAPTASAPELMASTALPGGRPIDAAMRRAFELGTLEATARSEPGPPHPWRSGEQVFVAWLNSKRAADQPASRYLQALYDLRPDLQATIAPEQLDDWARISGREDGIWWRLIPSDPNDYVDHLAESSRDTTSSPNSATERHPDRSLDPSPERPDRSAPVEHPRGVNVVGFLRGELGVGEHGRLLLDDVARSGEPVAAVSTSLTAHRQQFPLAAQVSIENPYDVNLLVVYPDALPAFEKAVGSAFFDDRINIGAWAWEVEGFPDEYRRAFDRTDEIWVESSHVRDALTRVSPPAVEVHVVPLGTRLPAAAGIRPPRRTHRDVLCTFLFVFDHASVTERKNPWAVVDAYRLAFPVFDSGRPTRLILKSINGDLHLDDHERLRVRVAEAVRHSDQSHSGREHPDIELRDGFVSSDEVAALMRQCDAYVSLHRAEGWGLTLAEAMAAGKAVMATAYSGNVDFMTSDNSWLIPYRMVEIPSSAGPYAGCGRWADPDVVAAAAAMREIRDDPEAAARRGARAARDMQHRARSSVGPEKIAERLDILRARRRNVRETTRSSDDMHDDPSLESKTAAAVVGSASETKHQPNDPTPNPDAHTFDHPGVGPVLLPTPPAAPGAAEGLRGIVQRAAQKAIAPITRRQESADLQRDIAVAHALGETRLAISALADQQAQLRRDLSKFTSAVTGAITHLEALQRAHDDLVRVRHDADAELARRLTRDLGDLRADLDRVRLPDETRSPIDL